MLLIVFDVVGAVVELALRLSFFLDILPFALCDGHDSDYLLRLSRMVRPTCMLALVFCMAWPRALSVPCVLYCVRECYLKCLINNIYVALKTNSPKSIVKIKMSTQSKPCAKQGTNIKEGYCKVFFCVSCFVCRVSVL
jgi:hypothetical protein